MAISTVREQNIQVKLTEAAIAKFEAAIASYDVEEAMRRGVHPIVAQAELDGMRSQVESLREERRAMSDPRSQDPFDRVRYIAEVVDKAADADGIQWSAQVAPPGITLQADKFPRKARRLISWAELQDAVYDPVEEAMWIMREQLK